MKYWEAKIPVAVQVKKKVVHIEVNLDGLWSLVIGDQWKAHQ